MENCLIPKAAYKNSRIEGTFNFLKNDIGNKLILGQYKVCGKNQPVVTSIKRD